MGWFGALKVIPWNDVVAAAPAVVRGAQQLWGKVRHDTAPADVPPPHSAAEPAADPLAELNARLDAFEPRLAAQGREAAAASELIASLAEQNARLIDAVERLRRQTRWLAAAAGVLGVGVVAALALAFAGR